MPLIFCKWHHHDYHTQWVYCSWVLWNIHSIFFQLNFHSWWQRRGGGERRRRRRRRRKGGTEEGGRSGVEHVACLQINTTSQLGQHEWVCAPRPPPPPPPPLPAAPRCPLAPPVPSSRPAGAALTIPATPLLLHFGRTSAQQPEPERGAAASASALHCVTPPNPPQTLREATDPESDPRLASALRTDPGIHQPICRSYWVRFFFRCFLQTRVCSPRQRRWLSPPAAARRASSWSPTPHEHPDCRSETFITERRLISAHKEDTLLVRDGA